jgi:hypothetical protein
MNGILTRHLNAIGHVERRYFAVPEGFALLTRLEQIDRAGMPLPESQRWEVNPIVEMNLGRFLESIFISTKGYFRFVAFIVADTSFGSGEPISRPGMQVLFARGYGDLPDDLGQRLVRDTTNCTVLIYEFVVTDVERETRVSDPSAIGARAHLLGLNLAEQLQ